MNVFICIAIALILALVAGAYFTIIKVSDDIEKFVIFINNAKADLEDIKAFIDSDFIDNLKKNVNKLQTIQEHVDEYGKLLNEMSNCYNEDRDYNANIRKVINRINTDIIGLNEKFNKLGNFVNTLNNIDKNTNEYVKHDNTNVIKNIVKDLADISSKIETMSKQINEFADKKKPATKLKTASKKDNYKNDGTDIVEQSNN